MCQTNNPLIFRKVALIYIMVPIISWLQLFYKSVHGLFMITFIKDSLVSIKMFYPKQKKSYWTSLTLFHFFAYQNSKFTAGLVLIQENSI